MKLREMGFKTVILSDNGEERVRRFLRSIDIPYVCEARKPGTAGFERALELAGTDRDKTVCIGDQMFTDILGANRSGIPSIMVRFIRGEGEKRIGKRRYLEYLILFFYRHSRYNGRLYGKNKRATKGNFRRFLRGEILFGDINPFCNRISTEKEILRRRLRDMRSGERFAKEKSPDKLPNVVYSYSSGLIKRGKDIDPTLQYNKAVNIDIAGKRINGIVIRPGEVFSFWRTVGRTTKAKGYLPGRIIEGGELKPGIGGGLCNLGNTVHLLGLHSPLDVTEVHHHSDALAPDHGKRVPFSSGTSVSYNYLDLRFKNNTDQAFQLMTWCQDEKLYAEIRSEREVPCTYSITEEGHHFRKEGEKYYRVSRIYRNTVSRETGETVKKELIRDNHSEVMFDPALIPKEQLI